MKKRTQEEKQIYRVFKITRNGVFPIDICLGKDKEKVLSFYGDVNIIFGRIK